MKNLILFCSLILVVLVSGCASVDFDAPKTKSTAVQNTNNTYYGKKIARHAAAHPNKSGFYLLTDGIEALAARILMARHAEVAIDVQYYLITNDQIGYAFIGSLLEAADRGVRVRLLLDDIQTKGYDAGMAALDSHPNFEVRIFNPFAGRTNRLGSSITEFGRINRRMHNKSFTVDNQITIVGGRNIAAEYFAARQDVNFGDVDVVGVGPISRDVSHMFDTYWNHRAAAPIEAFAKMPDDPAAALKALRGRIADATEGVRNTPYAPAFLATAFKLMETGAADLTWAPYELAYDSPDKSDKDMAKSATSIVTSLAETVRRGKKELIVISPYFVPLKSGTEHLTGLRDRGMEVSIVTNSLAATNHAIVHSGYAPFRKPLLKKGVKLYEVRPDAEIAGVDRGGAGAAIATLHTKGFIVDRRHLFLGSFNWDPRSAYINTELGVIIDSPKLAGYVAGALDKQVNQKTYEVVLNDKGKIRWIDRSGEKPIELKKEPQSGFWRRFMANFYRMFPIKGQL